MTNSNAIELENNNVESNSTPSMAMDVETSSAPTNESEYDENHKKKRKLISPAWDHFKKMKVGGVMKAICEHCHKHLGGESKNEKFASLDTYHFNPEVSRYELGRMIVLYEYPLSIVEHEGFRRYSNSLQPFFKVPSRNTIRADIFKMYEIEKQKLQRVLESNSSRVAITTDMWTASNQKRGYMAITAHFIDESWTLQDQIMRFMYVPSPHDAENLGNALMECLLDWNIERKLLTLTLDNCSTNDAMMNIMLDKLDKSSLLVNGKLLHMRCAAHILNLIVKEGLENLFGSGVERIRESIAFWTATPKRLEKFEESIRHLNISCSKVISLDIKTRWNSTYLMLSTALIFKDVFSWLSQREPQYRKLGPKLPSEEDWVLAKEMCERLKPFFKITELFSGTSYPTINIFFPKICEVRLQISSWYMSQFVEIRTVAEAMVEKFEKYWLDIHGILALAVILDPRYKMDLVDFQVTRIYGKDEAQSYTKKVLDMCYDLVSQYQAIQSKDDDLDSSSDFSCINEDADPLSDYDMYISIKKRSKSGTKKKTELDLYLDEEVLPRSANFDILSWWKTSSLKYPTLGKIARDILAIPVTTVASESAFTTGGKCVSRSRSRLHPRTIEALVCTQDWLWSTLKDPRPLQLKHVCPIEFKDQDRESYCMELK